MWSEAPPVSVVDMRLRPGFGLDPKMAGLCHALAADDMETGKLDKGPGVRRIAAEPDPWQPTRPQQSLNKQGLWSPRIRATGAESAGRAKEM